MLRPTLIVGLGTTGLNVVSEIQKLMYETFGVNRLPIFRFLYVETDLNKSHEQTPAGSDIIPITVSVDSLERAYRNLSTNQQLNLDWISSELLQSLTYNGQGAGGVRPAGRLLLWGDQENKNFKKFYDALSDAFREIVNPAARVTLQQEHDDAVTRAGGFSPLPVVYVVGTLVGGTCSGTFIDIGYMIRWITGLQETGALYGVFLVPGEGLPLQAGYGNSYGALQEADYFRAIGNYYQETWPNGVRIDPQRLPPYAITYLASAEYGRRAFANMSLGGCVKAVALKLFCDLVGMSDLRGAVLTDGMNEGFGAYATFGISAILYPKYALMEATGCEKGIELCDRWLMAQSYRTATGELITINQSAIFAEADQFLADALEHAFSTLGAKGASGLDFDVQEDINRVVRGEEGAPDRYLADRFTAGVGGNYHNAVADNVSTAQDQLIKAIRDFVFRRIQDTENLDYVEKLLQQIAVSLQRTKAYWDRAGVPNAVNEWNDYVSRAARRMTRSTFAWLGQKRNVMEDRAINLLTVLKMFVMRRVLDTLESSIQRGSLATRDKAVTLPTIEQLAEARRRMQDARDELVRRAAAVADEVRDISVPIHRVWYSGSFEGDCANLRQGYGARYGVTSLSDVVPGTPPLEFLTRTRSHDIFAKLKVGYQRRFRDHLPQVNVIEKARQDVNVTRQYADRALSGLLRLNPPGQSGQAGIPRFVLGSDTAPLEELVRRLKEEGLQELQPSHVRPLALLDNAVVFYEEKSRITPLAMLEVKETMKYWFETPATDPTGMSTTPKALWRQQRLAYNLERRRRVTRVGALTNLLLDFAFVTTRKPYSDDWRVESVRWNELPIDAGPPPKFLFHDAGGITREYVLDPAPETVRRLADDQACSETLNILVAEKLKNLGESSLVKLFNEEVRPYLLERFGEHGVNQKADFYFGAASRKDGFLYVLLGEAAKGATAAKS
jgi:hypothetical protein